MKIKSFTLFIISIVCLYCCNPGEDRQSKAGNTELIGKTQDPYQVGDIIFQESSSGQSKAIQLATHSKYSHVGMLFKQRDKWFVLEAIQPVSMTPLDEFIKRGDHGKYVIKRLKNRDSILTVDAIKILRKEGLKLMGKNYDLYFGWSDEKIYCSELVWKVYKKATYLELGKLQKLKDFDLSHPIVQSKLKERYQNKIPYDEEVISPAAIYESDLLEEVIVK